MDSNGTHALTAQPSETLSPRKVSQEGLRDILEKHKQWLISDGREGKKADLAGINLREASLAGANLQGANLEGANLREVDLQEANLRADLPKADLRGANLQRADLRGANLQKADLRGAALQEASLGQSNLQSANLRGVAFLGSDLQEAQLQQAQLQQAQFQNVNLVGANLSKAKLAEANLQNVALRGANLSEADLQRANLQQADLLEVNLQGANLAEANLQKAIFTQVDLTNVTFRKTNLWEASLEGAHVKDATDLLGEQLGGAYVVSAELPEPIKKSWEEGLATIAETSKEARLLFYAMLLVCAYAWLTIATTTDVRLLTNSVSLPLPIIGVQIPIGWFYGATPFGLLALYIYLHLSLQSLWEELAHFPAYFPDGKSLDKRIYPWLLSGLVHFHFAKLKNRDKPPVSRLQARFAMPFVWWAIPLTMVAFWLKYLRRHDWFVTALHLVLLAGVIAGAFWFQSLTRLTLRGQLYTSTPPRRSAVPYKKIAGVGVLVFLVTLGVSCGAIHGIRSISSITLAYPPYQTVIESPDDLARNIWTQVPRALALIRCSPFANFEEADVSTKLPNWTGSDLALAEGAHLKGRNLRYAAATRAFLVKADMREVDLHEAVLVKADLRQASLDNAKLRRARLEGANLQETTLIRADLRQAQFWEAILKEADLRGADLTGAIGLTREQIMSARRDEYTRLPSHLSDLRIPTPLGSGE